MNNYGNNYGNGNNHGGYQPQYDYAGASNQFLTKLGFNPNMDIAYKEIIYQVIDALWGETVDNSFGSESVKIRFTIKGQNFGLVFDLGLLSNQTAYGALDNRIFSLEKAIRNNIPTGIFLGGQKLVDICNLASAASSYTPEQAQRMILDYPDQILSLMDRITQYLGNIWGTRDFQLEYTKMRNQGVTFGVITLFPEIVGDNINFQLELARSTRYGMKTDILFRKER